MGNDESVAEIRQCGGENVTFLGNPMEHRRKGENPHPTDPRRLDALLSFSMEINKHRGKQRLS